MRPHRQQPTRLPRPWDSPGKKFGPSCPGPQFPHVWGFWTVMLEKTLEYWSGVPLPSLLIHPSKTNFRLPASRIVEGYTAAVLSYQIYGNLLQRQQKANRTRIPHALIFTFQMKRQRPSERKWLPYHHKARRWVSDKEMWQPAHGLGLSPFPKESLRRMFVIT